MITELLTVDIIYRFTQRLVSNSQWTREPTIFQLLYSHVLSPLSHIERIAIADTVDSAGFFPSLILSFFLCYSTAFRVIFNLEVKM